MKNLQQTFRSVIAVFPLALLLGCGTAEMYVDQRPYPVLRMDARDQGVVFRHGSAPDSADVYGARDVWVFQADSTYFMHYDGAGPLGWLSIRAHSSDLQHWTVEGPVLPLGNEGEEDSRSASYGVTVSDGSMWHMFYLGTQFTSPPPERVPALPYLTLKARSGSPRGPWTKEPNVVPFRPTPGTYYSHTASPGQIIRHNGEYLQFFSAAVNIEGIRRSIGIARTTNLDSSWTLSRAPIVPLREQIENAAIYFEETSQTWFLFTNHVGLYKDTPEYTDAIWVYWTKDVMKWNPAHKAIVLDKKNCLWSRRVIGLPSVVRLDGRLALFYDGVEGNGTRHTGRDIGLAWLSLPLQVPAAGKE
jgi:predicted GH43/DUF377 family glycosyl hydrolase